MKTTFKSLAILMMAAAGFAACDDDSSDDSGNKEYALSVKFNIQAADSTFQDLIPSIQEKAATSAGFLKKDYLYITARDSADAAPKVQEIGKRLEDELDKNASQMSGNVYLMAIEKQQLEASDSKQRNWSCWYMANYPSAANGFFLSDWFDEVYYVYHLELHNEDGYFHTKPKEKQFNIGDERGECITYVSSYDLNNGAGGNYLYFLLSGVTKATHPDYKDQLITDVVMLNTRHDPHYPEYVDIPNTVDGKTRRYYPVFAQDHGANGSTCHDLNDGAGGPYLWMYYTTDYRDGWVLSSYATVDGSSEATQVTTTLREKKFENWYYMHAYYKNQAGKWVDYGIAEMNEGASKNILLRGQCDLYFSMKFRKVQ